MNENDQFIYAVPTPTITSIMGNSGSVNGRTYVTIYGSNLVNIQSVYFGTKSVATINSVSPNSFYVKSPSGTSGNVDITVNTLGGTAISPTQFTYYPLITNIYPQLGKISGNDYVDISGIGFTTVKNVYFGNIPALSFTFISDTHIIARSPPSTSGIVDIIVATSNGTSTEVDSDKFIYSPYITIISPSGGSIYGGDLIQINGIGLSNVTNVYFGSVPANIFSVTDSQITVISPRSKNSANGINTTVDVVAVDNTGQTRFVSSDKFTYLDVPVITSVLPNEGTVTGGSSVDICGNRFTGATAVYFGNVSATSFTVVNDDEIVAITPSVDEPKIVHVTVTTPNGRSIASINDEYIYRSNEDYQILPIVTNISPNTGSSLGGTTITINGTGFTPGSTVFFGGLSAPNVNVISATEIQCNSPVGSLLISGYPFHVNVVNENGRSIDTENDEFTYFYGDNYYNYINDLSYSGIVYAIYGIGGFQIEQGFPKIKLASQSTVNQYDVTNALQVKIDVRMFNEKLGLYKNTDNNSILSTTYTSQNNAFSVDSISISASEFVSHMSVPQVLSVGAYATIYSNFSQYVNTYFSYPIGFTSLFSNAYDISFNNNIFDANAFINIINGQTIDSTGAYVNDLSGSITIFNVNSIIRNIVETNVFGNRNDAHFGVGWGFMAGDLIFIPSGTTTTLQLEIDPLNNPALNSIGSTNVESVSSTFNYNNGFYSSSASASLTNISQVLTTPLLIILSDL